MFSAKLERLRQFDRLAVLVAATLLCGMLALIAVWARRALNMLEAAEVDSRADHHWGAHRIGGSCGLMPYRLRRSPGCRPLDVTLSLRSLTGRGLAAGNLGARA